MKNNEALRCLLCKKPRCSISGCPVHTPVPECMVLYREDRIEEAAEILFRNNPLSAITSRVCDWKKFCLGNCVLNVKKIPVRWYEIEQEISEAYLRTVTLPERASNGKSVAIVGAGPAGIAAAIWLHGRGFEVSVFDSNEEIGGVLRYGIPPFRLDRSLVSEYKRIFDSAGIVFKGGIKVGKDLTLKSLSQSFTYVFIATGAEKPLSLGIPGEESPKVIDALKYLKNPGSFELGKKVIVIGGGNVAMDSCRTAARSGVDTWVYYRKTFENMPANPFEIEEAQRDGVHFELFKAPVEVRENGVVFRECENVTDPDTGKVTTRIIDGTDSLVPCDTLIPAISERPDLSVFGDMMPQTNRWGYPEASSTGMVIFPDGTSNVFAAGDLLLGPRTVVEAVASARKAIESIL